jgi:transglutaminase/protease-like cytokinesis protein 3
VDAGKKEECVMAKRLHVGKVEGVILMVVFSWLLLFHCDTVLAEELPKDVVVVSGEKKMMKALLKGMKRHEKYFAFYYPGIAEDFREYEKQSRVYQTFFDKLAAKDGYTMGIVSGSCVLICGTEKEYVTFQFGYLTTLKQEKKIDRKVKKIVKQVGKGSHAAKIRKVHDYLLQHMQYDNRYYSPYDAFAKGRGMCMAYALSFQRIMQEMGIPCLYVRGKNHAWNMVKIGDCWYNMDVTWDDAGGNPYRYFLKSDRQFSGHSRPKTSLFQSLPVAKTSYK